MAYESIAWITTLDRRGSGQLGSVFKGGRLKARRWARFYSFSDKDHDFISLEAVEELIMKEEGAEINATDHISVKVEQRIR